MATMLQCPDCEGVGIVEKARPCFGRDSGDWDTYAETCDRCGGDRHLGARECCGCHRVLPADEINRDGYCDDCIQPDDPDEEIPCPDCEGKGEVEHIMGGDVEWRQCDRCNGSRVIKRGEDW